MKRYGNLYARICDIGNLREAAHNAASGKRKRDEVTAFFANLEENLVQLHRELTEKRYKTSPYDVKYINCHSVTEWYTGRSCRCLSLYGRHSLPPTRTPA